MFLAPSPYVVSHKSFIIIELYARNFHRVSRNNAMANLTDNLFNYK